MLENYIDNMCSNIKDFNTYNCVLGVDYGGAIIAEYIKYKYTNIKNIGYIRPRKQRNKKFYKFFIQLSKSYTNAFIDIFTRKLKSRFSPYYPYIEWCDINIKNDKILIIDDGLLSGGTSISIIDYMNNIKYYNYKMYVLHGMNRSYKNKLNVYQKYQLCYLPWGQT